MRPSIILRNCPGCQRQSSSQAACSFCTDQTDYHACRNGTCQRKTVLFMISFITIVKPVSWVLSFIPPYGMRAAGDVKFSMITSCCTMWLCRVSLCIYLCRVWGFGPIAVWIGMFSDWTLRAIIFSIRFHSRKWLNHRVIENDDIPFCDLPLHIFLRCCFSFYRMRQPFCLHAGQNCLILRHLHYHLFIYF